MRRACTAAAAAHHVQVKDELRKVLDGVDVVVRRGRDEGHARLAAPQVCDVGADLLARQLPSLPCRPVPSSQLKALVEARHQAALVRRDHCLSTDALEACTALHSAWQQALRGWTAVLLHCQLIHQPALQWQCASITDRTRHDTPGLAPWAILISSWSELTRNWGVTPKRPLATCLMREDAVSPVCRTITRSDTQCRTATCQWPAVQAQQPPPACCTPVCTAGDSHESMQIVTARTA